MNPIRKQRLYALIAILIGSLLATWLVVSALSENMNLFYSPTEIKEANLDQGTLIRAGGMVKAGSIIKSKDSLDVSFTVTDYQSLASGLHVFAVIARTADTRRSKIGFQCLRSKV